jgi:hypothetical protein
LEGGAPMWMQRVGVGRKAVSQLWPAVLMMLDNLREFRNLQFYRKFPGI